MADVGGGFGVQGSGLGGDHMGGGFGVQGSGLGGEHIWLMWVVMI